MPFQSILIRIKLLKQAYTYTSLLGGFFMFLVMSKEKIYAYGISILTVVVLFYVATTMNATQEDTVLTAGAVNRYLPIYQVDTPDKKVALTLNCAWNDSDIDQILAILQKKQIKVTFFMVGEWMEKYPESVKKIDAAGQNIRKPFTNSSSC